MLLPFSLKRNSVAFLSFNSSTRALCNGANIYGQDSLDGKKELSTFVCGDATVGNDTVNDWDKVGDRGQLSIPVLPKPLAERFHLFVGKRTVRRNYLTQGE